MEKDKGNLKTFHVITLDFYRLIFDLFLHVRRDVQGKS